MKINFKSIILLLIAAAIWGVAFVAQDVSSETLSPFTITGVRSLIGFAGLMLLTIIKAKHKKEKSSLPEKR